MYKRATRPLTHSQPHTRPQNLCIGRMYDHHLLDMAELGVEQFRPMVDFEGIAGGSAAESKPCLLFEGAEWESVPELKVRARRSLKWRARVRSSPTLPLISNLSPHTLTAPLALTGAALDFCRLFPAAHGRCDLLHWHRARALLLDDGHARLPAPLSGATPRPPPPSQLAPPVSLAPL